MAHRPRWQPPHPTPLEHAAMTTPTMSNEAADWIRLNALPPLRRRDDGIEELRTCVCQAPPSGWLGGIQEPAARLWNCDGRTVAWSRDVRHGRYVAGLVAVWEVDRVCRRRRPPAMEVAVDTARAILARPVTGERR